MGLLSKAISIQVITGRSRGLLRRLTVYSRELDRETKPPPRLSGRSSDGPVPPPAKTGTGGLLKKSLLFLNFEKEETPESESFLIVDFTENIQRLLKQIERLAKDFSFFPGLYSLLMKELHLPQSAFFIGSALKAEFVPWMHRGLDSRLVPELVFSETAWNEFSRAPSAAPYLLTDEKRLFAGLPRPLPKPLFMFPFTDRGALEGSLLVSNFPVSGDSRASLCELFRTLSAKIGPAIAALTKGLKGLTRPEHWYATPAEALSGFLEGERGKTDSFRVATLPLSPFFKALSGQYGFFDKKRLREIILFAVNCCLSRLGTGTAFGDEDILLVSRGAAFYSPRLLASLLSNYLKDLFKGLFDAAPPLLPSRVIEYPAGGKKSLEILAELQS
jgi:hypothetical protein